MLDTLVSAHIARLKAATFDDYDLAEIPRYLEENTYLNGSRFSFKDHEYQLDILSDISRVVYCQKCAQVGLTESQLRYVAAISRLIPYFNTIMTWPTSTDAENMIKTRMNPILYTSADLRDRLNADLNNVQIKELGTSLIYARGTRGETAALSVPADLLVHDEVDRSDAFTLGQFQSRLKHSRFKMVRAFGTPTVDGYGIALLMETAQRKKHLCKCNHCNHFFLPDYDTDVIIPDWDHDKKEINKYNLPKTRWEEAYLVCPRCGKQPDLSPAYRSWVVENPGDNFEAQGYFVSPFSAPKLVTVPALVKESTNYGTYGEFRNQALGLTSTDSNESLIKADIMQCATEASLESTELHYMGADMGLICHVVVGRMTLAGELLVVHRERVLMEKFEERKRALAIRYRVKVSVCDAYPYTDMILRMQRSDKNLYGAIYHQDKKLAMYRVVHVDEDKRKGKMPITQASIHRNLNFDEVMHLFKKNKIVWAKQDETEDTLFERHCLSMKRKQELDVNSGMVYAWVKSANGQDHYHHALGYLHVACLLAKTATSSLLGTAVNVPLMVKFQVKH
jgi:hypothetical protein